MVFMNHGLRSARSALAGTIAGLLLLFGAAAAAGADSQTAPPPQSRTLSPPGPSASSGTEDTTDYVALFQQIFKSVENRYVDKPDPKKLFEGAMKGLFDSLGDPHSYYLTQSLVKDFTDTTSGRFGGVGLIISKSAPSGGSGANGATGADAGAPNGSSGSSGQTLPGSSDPAYVEVVSPIHGTPAYRAGISAGDRITKIEGESTAPMTIDDVVNKLRGTPGTSVKVTILRGDHITFNVSLTRAIIEVPVVRDAMIQGDIGYIRIIQYTPLTPQKVREAVDTLRHQGATSLIIDERGNPGGLLSAVVTTSDYFLSSGIIVSTRSRIPSDNEVFTAHSRTIVPESLPIIVLIDKGSASAAEIFAGALRDHNRALLVGETSFGKGSVQQVFFLRSGDGAYKLTTAKYYTPNGQNIDKIGIEPDVVVKEPTLTQKEQEDLKKLIEENTITTFVREDPRADESKINAFVSRLHNDGITLDDYTLKRLIHNEQDRMQNDPPVYDLTYDKVLQKAVTLLSSGQYSGKGM